MHSGHARDHQGALLVPRNERHVGGYAACGHLSFLLRGQENRAQSCMSMVKTPLTASASVRCDDASGHNVDEGILRSFDTPGDQSDETERARYINALRSAAQFIVATGGNVAYATKLAEVALALHDLSSGTVRPQPATEPGRECSGIRTAGRQPHHIRRIRKLDVYDGRASGHHLRRVQ